ncbi:MAG: MarR family transcriptional regulator [Gemmatimonadaceae bacterium]|nr:MarR family transcriptional regulator [Gemmatimonadaceae bacterium]
MQVVLQPIDVPVALSLCLTPGQTFARLGAGLRISPSTAHQAVRRLVTAGLVFTRGARHEANVAGLEEFLRHGVRYAFPPERGRRQRGVPTAHGAPGVHGTLGGDIEPLVWPSPSGKIAGTSLTPLAPAAADLIETQPELYELLALVDLFRVGTARDRAVAGELLSKRLIELAQ